MMGTMEIYSRQGQFEPVRVNHGAGSGFAFDLLDNNGMLSVLIRIYLMRRF